MLEIRLNYKLNNNYCGISGKSRKLMKMVVIPLVLLILLECTDTAKAFPFVRDGDRTEEITDNRLLTDFSDSTVSEKV